MTRKVDRLTFVAAVALALGCGPEVRILEPQEGEVVADSQIAALIEFTQASRTFEVALDGADVSGSFFVTDKEAGGTLSGLSNGEHLLQVSYTATSGFSDTDSVRFEVQSDAVLSNVVVSPQILELAPGDTAELTVTGALSDGTTVDLTTSADTIYESSDGEVATVATGGVVTAVAAGEAFVAVSNNGLNAVVTVTVAEAAGGSGSGTDDTAG